jgi:transposase
VCGGGDQKGLSAAQSQAAQGLGRSRGGLTTKLHLLAEGHGRPLAKQVTPGQAADYKQVAPLLEKVSVARPGRGRPRKRLAHLTADKAYSVRAVRRTLRVRKIPHTIPERKDHIANRARRGSQGGRPPNFDPERYKDRNQIERAFNRLKQFRAVATRYDKLKVRYEATVTVASIMVWLRMKIN